MDWRPLAVTIRSHQVDGLAATPVASVVESGCRPAARTQRVRINSPVPTPGGTVGKNKVERSAGIEPASSAWKAEAHSHWTNPAQIEGFVSRFTAPRLHATDRSVRRTLGGGISGGLRAGPLLSLPVCPRPCAGGKANQNSVVLTRGKNCPSACDHDGL